MILVTGASGNVGSALLGELRVGGHAVRAAYRSPDRTAAETGAGREAVKLDLAQPETLPSALEGVDTRDIARVAARVLTTSGHDGQVYDISGPEALTYDQAAGVFSGALGEPVRFVGLADADARADMLSRGLPAGYADVLIEKQLAK